MRPAAAASGAPAQLRSAAVLPHKRWQQVGVPAKQAGRWRQAGRWQAGRQGVRGSMLAGRLAPKASLLLGATVAWHRPTTSTFHFPLAAGQRAARQPAATPPPAQPQPRRLTAARTCSSRGQGGEQATGRGWVRAAHRSWQGLTARHTEGEIPGRQAGRGGAHMCL